MQSHYWENIFCFGGIVFPPQASRWIARELREAIYEERSGRSGSPPGFRFAETFAISTGIRIEASVAAVALGVDGKAIILPGRFFQPAENPEMIPPAIPPDRGLYQLFVGDEQCFIFLLIQPWPPVRTVPRYS
jgi:hypothetical protein